MRGDIPKARDILDDAIEDLSAMIGRMPASPRRTIIVRIIHELDEARDLMYRDIQKPRERRSALR